MKVLNKSVIHVKKKTCYQLDAADDRPTLTFGFRLPKVSNLMREVTGTTPKKALLDLARLGSTRDI